MEYKIITDVENFIRHTKQWDGPIVCDVETKDPNLLGIALCDTKQLNACYIPIRHWDKTRQVWNYPLVEQSLENYLKEWLNAKLLIGYNFVYDRWWIDTYFSIKSVWTADPRIMWHLSSAPSGPRPYSLKDAQKELLGWKETNEKELDENVRAQGGNLHKGDHYLADLHILGKYACLDARSTAEVYNKLHPWFIEHNYEWMLDMVMQYNVLLDANTRLGVRTDIEGLKNAKEKYEKQRDKYKKEFLKELKDPIEIMERDWADRKIASYKREYNRIRYETHPEEWQRFNLNSDKDKRELFYDKLKQPILYRTEGDKPATNADAIKRMKGSFVEPYLKYEKANTLTSNFIIPYISSSASDGKLHPGFNICGTVSYRLSGFKPYLLNAPFDEKAIMCNLQVDDGYVGVHADLSAIEPSITAHYSEDPSLLKVFQAGLGDIYLDLALELFPNDIALQQGYNPNAPITKSVKTKFERQRKIAKVIQLAVQYTGTGHTVAKNLSKEGMSTTVEEATGYVRAYWRKFRKVAEFQYRLRELNRKQGYLRNVIGRIIQVPDPEYKDLANRFIQSSAHDVLMLWVLEIYALAKAASIDLRPVLLDCHDSTSNQCPEKNVDRVQAIYKEALKNINERLALAVTIKAETKTFRTLAGLKGEE